MRYEVHLVHAPREAHAGLLRIARSDSSVLERAVIAAMQPQAGSQLVAQYGSARSAERLQVRLTEAGCSAVVVDRGSALARWLDARFGSHDPPAASSEPVPAPIVEPPEAGSAPVDDAPKGLAILRQDPELRRRAEQAEIALRWRRRALGAAIGAVAFAVLAGLLAVVSSLVRTEPIALSEDTAASEDRGGQPAGGTRPPGSAAVGDESGTDDLETELAASVEGQAGAPAAPAEARQVPPSAAAANPAHDLVPPTPAAPLRPDAVEQGSAGRIVGSAIVFLLAMSLGFGLLYFVRWITDALPRAVRNALRLFAAAALVLIAAASAFVQIQVTRRANAAAVTAQAASEERNVGASQQSVAATTTPGATVQSFVAQLTPPAPPQRFGPMAERLLTPATEGSGAAAGAGEGSGLVAADAWEPSVEDQGAGSPDMRSFVASLPQASSQTASDCPDEGGEFARMACALRGSDETGSGSQVAIVAREPVPEPAPTEAAGGSGAAAPAEPRATDVPPAPPADGAQTAEAQSPPAAGPASGEEALPSDSIPPTDETPIESPPPEPPPERSPFALPALAGFGSGTVLELLLVPWIRRRRRSA